MLKKVKVFDAKKMLADYIKFNFPIASLNGIINGALSKMAINASRMRMAFGSLNAQEWKFTRIG